MNESSLIITEQHFLSNKHDLNSDSKFILRERTEKNINMKSINTKEANKYVNILKIYVQFGMINKIQSLSLDKKKDDCHKLHYEQITQTIKNW